MGVRTDLHPVRRHLSCVLPVHKVLHVARQLDGSFSPQRAGPGISAVVAAGLLRNGFNVDDPVVARTLAYLEKKVQADGGIYDKFLANYTTSVALMAFAEANKDHRYDAVMKRATEFLRTMQYDENTPE